MQDATHLRSGMTGSRENTFLGESYLGSDTRGSRCVVTVGIIVAGWGPCDYLFAESLTLSSLWALGCQRV